MANKPVLGIIDCPHCGRANMVMKPARSARLSIGMTKHTEFRTGS